MSLPRIADRYIWTTEITQDAEAEMTALVEIYNPSSATRTDYQPLLDTGGKTTAAILATCKARVIRLRRPQATATADQAITNHPVRFQIPISAYSGLISRGMRVRVLDGGDDSALTSLVYVVSVAINGSLAAVRTIETEAETQGGAA